MFYLSLIPLVGACDHWLSGWVFSQRQAQSSAGAFTGTSLPSLSLAAMRIAHWLVLVPVVYSKGACLRKNQVTTTSKSTQPPKPMPIQAAKPISLQAQVDQATTLSVSSLVSSFLGVNSGIASHFVANLQSDNTNGNSWCGYPYNDYTPGFAPSLNVMSKGTNAVYASSPQLWEKFAQMYCGLEAKFTTKDGKTQYLYIADAFEFRYLEGMGHPLGSVDIMSNSWNQLAGRKDNGKEDVLYDVKWELTGRRNPRYAFKGQGN
jgi:hypothetical protein